MSEEPENKETKPTAPKKPENAAHITLMNLQSMLMDPHEIIERRLNPYTCREILKLMKDMMAHGGNIIKGIRTIDGMTMYPCAKHEYAPISNCIKDCDYFNGNDNLGICVCTEGKIIGFPIYSHFEALQIEENLRKNKVLTAPKTEDIEKEEEQNAANVDDW